MIKAKYIAMAVIFLFGMWGGNELIKRLSNEPEAQLAATSMVGKPIPDFSLPDLDNHQHNIHEWDGNVVVLNFWATWCPPCLKETPLFVEMQEQYGPKGLQFIGVAIDTLEKVKDFVDTYGVNYPTLIATDKDIHIAEAYGNRFGALPYTVVINRQGQISHIHRGEFSREAVKENVLSLL
ncbi:MAG: TlpA family protein disulfide reductase [Gammaproteobacteria bacterium]|nr:TlpA family protein disulfide reductase [Gammaproteobacteria bacterium]MDH5803236.1 TlpA family protein disulfide reductase [Gammaproteobacteria bacterium]